MERRNFYFFVAIVFLVLIGFFPTRGVPFQEAQIINAFPINPPPIEASSGLAVDLLTGKHLFEKNATTTLPLASVTKIVTALTILDHLSLTDTILVSKQAILTEGTSSLRPGEHLSVKDLLAMAMVESSNDAVSVLVEGTVKKMSVASPQINQWFTQAMHEKAISLGAPSMVFNDPTGLDISKTESGAYGSAEDLMNIARNSYASPIWRLQSQEKVVSEEGISHLLTPTSTLDKTIPQLIGAKTGFTDLAGGNLLVLVEYPIGHPVGIVVLGSSTEGRFEDVKKIFEFIKIL